MSDKKTNLTTIGIVAIVAIVAIFFSGSNERIPSENVEEQELTEGELSATIDLFAENEGISLEEATNLVGQGFKRSINKKGRDSNKVRGKIDRIIVDKRDKKIITPISCEDSENGKSEFTQGSVSYKFINKRGKEKTVNRKDRCIDANTVKEFYCSEDGILADEPIPCEFACDAGICISETQSLVQTCLKEISDSAINVAMLQGGTYVEDGFDKLGATIYVLAGPDENGNLIILNEFSKESLKNSAETFFNDDFKLCINNFNSIQSSLEIESGDYKIDITVRDRNVIFQLDYLITVFDGINTETLDSFRYTRRTNVGLVAEVVNGIVSRSITDNDVPVEYIVGLIDEGILKTWVYTIPKAGSIGDNPFLEGILYSLSFTDGSGANFIIDYNWGDVVVETPTPTPKPKPKITTPSPIGRDPGAGHR